VPHRILLVDDNEPNVRLLRAKLAAEFYEVITASDGRTALALAASRSPDIILLDIMMPVMDGFAVCRELKDDPLTRHIPVVLVTALDGRADRITGLEAGADEFLSKPIDDGMLFSRMRHLIQLKTVVDELRQRQTTAPDEAAITACLTGAGGRILICDDNERQAKRIAQEIAGNHRVLIQGDAERALQIARHRADLLIINANAQGFDGLRLAAEVRADRLTRDVPMLAVMDPDQRSRMAKALEMGVNDILPRPIDPLELVARVRNQVRRKQYVDFLRSAPKSPRDPEHDTLDQRPAPYAFAVANGQLHAVVQTTAPEDRELTDEVLELVREKAELALSDLQGNHADKRLLASVRSFLECISAPADAIRVGRLLMRFRSLQSDAAAYLDPLSERDTTISSIVADLAVSAGDLMSLYPKLRSVEAARMAMEFPSDPKAIEAYQGNLAAIRELVEGSPAVTPSVAEALHDGDAELAQLSSATTSASDTARAAAIQRRAEVAALQALSLRNFLATAIKVANTEVRPVAGETWREVKAAIPRGVGKAVERAMSGSVTVGLVYLVSTFAGPLMGLGALVGTFQPLAQRANAIREAIVGEEDKAQPA